MMKYLIFLFLFCVAATSAQQLYSVTPVINSKEIGSIVVTAGSATVYSTTKPFAGVSATTLVQGARFPIGTKVVSNTNDSILVLSSVAWASASLDSLRFDVNTSLQYTAGDALGFPFQLPDWAKEIDNVVVVDTAKQITSIKFLYLDSAFAQTEDNSALAISDNDSKHISGYMLVDSSVVFSSNQIIVRPFNQVPLYFGSKKTYVQPICVGTPTFVTNKALKFNFLIK